MSEQNTQKTADPTGFPPPGFVPGVSSVPGIEVFIPAEKGKELPEIIDCKCPKCGAITAYNVIASGLSCDHCGYNEIPEQKWLGKTAECFEFRVETMERSEKGWGEERKEPS